MRDLRRALGIASLVLLGTACVGHLVYASGSYRGRVTDAETQEPLVGAVVLAIWYREVPVAPHGPARDYIDALEVLTDPQGEFTIPERTHVTLIGRILEPKFIIYYPGYGDYPYYQVRPRDHEIPGAYGKGFFDVALRRWRTPQELRRSTDFPVGFDDRIPMAKIPNLLRLINVFRQSVGLQPIGGQGN